MTRAFSVIYITNLKIGPPPWPWKLRKLFLI